LARAVRGISATFPDLSSAALADIWTAMNEYRSAGDQLGITALYVLLSPALLSVHQCEAALELIEQGLATTSRNSERMFEAELYRLKARVLLFRGGSEAGTEAQSLLDHALTTARTQHAKALEVRVAVDFAALWMDQGRCKEALDLLAPIYAWFTEGLETQDLRQAKALLDRLR
jgi:predicted ATPase